MFTSALAPVPSWFAEVLRRELESTVSLSDLQIQQLYTHYDFLARWNQRMNLTTVKLGPEAVVRHYCESLFFAAHLPSEGGASILDLGSGAGFPGVPLAILKPEWRITLVESHQRKAVFLRESTRHLSNVNVLAERIESLSAQADWVVSRAVDPVEVLDNIPRLGQNVGLMIGEDDFFAIRHPRIAWDEAIRLPWGDRKLCVFGRST